MDDTGEPLECRLMHIVTYSHSVQDHVLLLIDNHDRHTTTRGLDLAMANMIVIVTFPRIVATSCNHWIICVAMFGRRSSSDCGHQRRHHRALASPSARVIDEAFIILCGHPLLCLSIVDDYCSDDVIVLSVYGNYLQFVLLCYFLPIVAILCLVHDVGPRLSFIASCGEDERDGYSK